MYRISSLAFGCILAVSLGASASAGALSGVTGLASSVGNAASSAVGNATGTVSGVANGAANAVSGVANGATGAVAGAVSGATSAASGVANGAAGAVAGAVNGAVGTASGVVSGAAGAVGAVAGATSSAVAGAVGEAAGVVGSVAGAAAAATSGVAATAGAATSSDPAKTLSNAAWFGGKPFKFHKVYLVIKKQSVAIVKRDAPVQAGGATVIQTKTPADVCSRFLDQFKLLQSFSLDALYRNCPDIARSNGARASAQ